MNVAGGLLLRKIGGFNFEVELQNISCGGCSVELVEACVVEERVVTRLPQLEALGTRVCWIRGNDAGLEFMTKLHPAVFDALISRLPQADAS